PNKRAATAVDYYVPVRPRGTRKVKGYRCRAPVRIDSDIRGNNVRLSSASEFDYDGGGELIPGYTQTGCGASPIPTPSGRYPYGSGRGERYIVDLGGETGRDNPEPCNVLKAGAKGERLKANA